MIEQANIVAYFIHTKSCRKCQAKARSLQDEYNKCKKKTEAKK